MNRTLFHLKGQISHGAFDRYQVTKYSQPSNRLSLNFIPFCRQRDSLGRLIKNKLPNQVPQLARTKDVEGSKNQCLPLLKKGCSQMKEQQIQQNILDCFSYKGISMKMARQTEGFKQRKNLLWNLKLNNKLTDNNEQNSLRRNKFQDDKDRIHYNQWRTLNGQLNRERADVTLYKDFFSKIQNKIHSKVSSCEKTKVNNGDGQIQMFSERKKEKKCITTNQKITIKYPNNPQKQEDKKIYIDSSQQKKSPSTIKIIDLKQLNKIIQLKTYSSLKKLQVKLADKMMQGHQRFLKKMIESKKLAHQIKLKLEQDD